MKRVTGQLLSFKSFRTAEDVLLGVELLRLIRKEQRMLGGHNPRFITVQL